MINQSIQADYPAMPVEYSEAADASILADIFDDQAGIVIWKRQLTPSIRQSAEALIAANPKFRSSVVVSPDNALKSFTESLSEFSCPELCEDIAELVGMFCMLLGVEHAGVRLGVLDNAMCPKFHVDRIPCRLITTYQGVATEWLPHELVDRSKLGHGAEGKADHESGLFKNPKAIQQLDQGDVALFKGDLWDGSEGAGLVHRSPRVESNSHRLLLTMDIVN